MSTEFIVLAAVVFLNTLLGLIVLQSNRERPAKIFSVLVFFVLAWAVANHLAEVVDLYFLAWFFIGATYAFAVGIAFFVFQFSLFFPKETDFVSLRVKKAALGGSILFSVFSFTPLVVGEIQLSDPLNSVRNGPFLPVFAIFFVFLFAESFFIMARKYKRAGDEEKAQLKYVILGILLTVAGSSSTNLLIPLLTGDSGVSKYGPFFTLFFVGFAAYAIMKHHLFSIKVVAAEVLTSVIWIALLVQVFASDTRERFIFNVLLLLFVLGAGIFLIRSVLNEVRQKEQLIVLNTRLDDLNTHLEEKVKEQTIEIRKAYEVEKKAKEELLALDKAKTDFILTTQHHLRTPLTVARAAVTSLGARQEGETYSNTDVSFIQKGIHAVDTLAKLMNEFLEISQMEVGKSILQKHPIPIRQLVENVLGELHDAIEEKRLTVSLTLSPEAEEARPELDAARFKDVALNLVDNCVRYTPKGGSLSIEGDIAVHPIEKTRSLILTFTDSGIGMTEDELARAFAQSFERGTRAKEMNATGRGLGLMLARQIVEAHGGRIRAESGGRDRGTRFMVEVPIEIFDK